MSMKCILLIPHFYIHSKTVVYRGILFLIFIQNIEAVLTCTTTIYVLRKMREIYIYERGSDKMGLRAFKYMFCYISF